MRVALVHDYLNQYGGAERVLEALIEIFPQAPIYTLFYDKEKTLGCFEGKIKGTSFLDYKFVWNHHRFFIPLMPMAANLLKLPDEYDLIISDSAGFGKGISCGRNALYISYCHTPLRYAWESQQYFNWPLALKMATAPIFSYLRRWDKKAGQKPNILIANSRYIAEKIKKYYQRDAEVVYPPVDQKIFYKEGGVKRSDYFLAIGRMLPYKRFDLIIEAFAKLKLPLKIVGSGPEEQRLKTMSFKLGAKNIEFVSFVKGGDGLRQLYNRARALIFPQVEDFGLVAAEAQACGTPVIAYAQGGAREIVRDGITGVLFHKQTAEGLAEAVERFSSLSFDEKVIERSAERFSKENFKQKILKLTDLDK